MSKPVPLRWSPAALPATRSRVAIGDRVDLFRRGVREAQRELAGAELRLEQAHAGWAESLEKLTVAGRLKVIPSDHIADLERRVERKRQQLAERRAQLEAEVARVCAIDQAHLQSAADAEQRAAFEAQEAAGRERRFAEWRHQQATNS